MKFILSFVLLLSFFAFNCKSPTAPKQNNPPDTTSNNFTWQKYYFGVGGYTLLNDVAIVNDSDIWAVGSIYLNDSTGKVDPLPYGFAKWDGHNWNIFRLKATASNGNTSNAEPNGILVFSENDIWFADGSIFYWDGKQLRFSLERYTFFNGGKESIEKLWGTSNDNIYGVGTLGTLVHFDGQAWQKIESGTKTSITDIWGSGNTILATVTNEYETGDKRLLQINPNGTVDSLNWSPNSRLQTVWFQSTDKIFIGGGKNIVGKPGDWKEITELPAYYSEKVRGNAPNDVFIVGAFGLCAHFNGSTWKVYNELYNQDESLYGLAVKGNLMVAVGQLGNRALIIIGKR